MLLTESRRLTGPNLLLDGPGAAAEISVPAAIRDGAIADWSHRVRQLLDAVGWSDSQITSRLYEGGATLAISAPIDALYAATEIVEAAWDFATAKAAKETLPDMQSAVDRLSKEISDEKNSALVKLAEAAASRHVICLPDDELVTIGLGRTSQSWPCDQLPGPDDVEWEAISDIPVALITGTNGKSTTARITASIGAAAGLNVGFSTSDWVKVGQDAIATGDYSGPEGARLALRHKQVDLAVLETARGGILRRGLPVPRASACLITNIASDHLGEYGIHTVDDLADAKFTLSKAVTQSGVLILNADDARLKSRGENFSGQVAWYGLSLNEADTPEKGLAAFVKEGHLCMAKDGVVNPILPIEDFTPALGGAAKHNVSNALGAILLSHCLGLDADAIKQGLRNFDSTPSDNPGRGNFMDLGGVKLLLDFAHNPHSLTALMNTLENIPAARQLVLCGQGGDRSDDDIHGMVSVIRNSNPDQIIIKEIPSKLRGRDLGEVPALIRKYLAEMNYPSDQTSEASSELDAVKMALKWARPGDLLVLLVYAQRNETLSLIETLQESKWQAGDPV